MTRIPKIFHFVFGLIPQTEPFHLMHYLCLASCLEVNKPEKIYFHYQHLPYGELWNTIKPHLTLCRVTDESFIQSFNYENNSAQQFRYAHISDIIRLEVLLKLGGIYADMDTLFIHKIPDALYEYNCVMGEEKVDWEAPLAQQAQGSLCNAFIMAKPQSMFLRQWLDEIQHYFNGSWSSHSTFLPYLLSKYPAADIHIEPKKSFFHFDWDPTGVDNIFLQNITCDQETYSIHLWAHLWWSPRRVDFSLFSHKELTPSYIAFAQTTYAIAARQFLPANIAVSQKQYQIERKCFAGKCLWVHTKSRLKHVFRKNAY